MRKPPLANQASVKLIAVLLGLMVIFNLFIMPTLTGDQAATPLDLQFAYTPEQAYQLIDSYSAETRQQYIIGEMTKDLAYPIVYTLFMSLSLALLLPQKWKLAWLPYTIFFFDILENIGIITLLINYPNKLITVAWCTSVFSSLKWTMVAVVTVIIFIGLVRKIGTKR